MLSRIAAAWLEPAIGVCTALPVVAAVLIAHTSEPQEHAMNDQREPEPDGLTDAQRNRLLFFLWLHHEKSEGRYALSFEPCGSDPASEDLRDVAWHLVEGAA